MNHNLNYAKYIRNIYEIRHRGNVKMYIRLFLEGGILCDYYYKPFYIFQFSAITYVVLIIRIIKGKVLSFGQIRNIIFSMNSPLS